MMADMKTTSIGMRRTLGDLVEHRLTLLMHCHKCRIVAELDVKRLIEANGLKISLKALLPSCIRENCGANWPDIDVEVPHGRQRKPSLGSD
jgi:hypothetical protein